MTVAPAYWIVDGDGKLSKKTPVMSLQETRKLVDCDFSSSTV